MEQIREAIPQQVVITKEVVEEVAKLQLTTNDTLILRVAESRDLEWCQDVLASFRQWLDSYDFKSVKILIIRGDTHVEALSLEEMSEKGWVRKKKSQGRILTLCGKSAIEELVADVTGEN